MPIVSRSGDTHYINEARRIQDNIQQLLLIASELGSSGGAGGGWLKGRLGEAKSLANETHRILKGFSITTTESSGTSTERSQRRDTYKKLNRRYQSALKTLDESAQTALRNDGMKYRSDSHPSHCALNSEIPSLYPESALGGNGDWESDDLSSHTSYPQQTQMKGYTDDDRRHRRRENMNHGSKELKHRDRLGKDSNYNSLEHFPENTRRDDFYRVAQPQLDLVDISTSYISDYPNFNTFHQQILNYPTPLRSSVFANGLDSSVVELKKTTTGGTSSTSSGTLRSVGVGSQRDLEFHPVRMVQPSELQARLLSEEARGVLQIENDVKGISQLYREMAWQVANESDDLDAIESQMRAAVDLSSHSVVNLQETNSMFQSHRRLKWYIIGGLGFLALLTALWTAMRLF